MDRARHLKGKLPDFIIAGVFKSGTTSLYENLLKHPDIEMTPNAFCEVKSGKMQNTKEVHFFNERWDNGVDWYQGLFNDNGKLQGEAASKYLFDKDYIHRMALTVPKAKIIVALRNPVTRAYSQHQFVQDYHAQSLSPKELSKKKTPEEIVKDMKVSRDDFDQYIRTEIERGIIMGHGIIGKGIYVQMLEELFKHFSRQQVMVIISERMKTDMFQTYQQIFDFLGVQRVVLNLQMNVNVGKRRLPMSSWAQENLINVYRPYNERLFKLLGYEIPEWNFDV